MKTCLRCKRKVHLQDFFHFQVKSLLCKRGLSSPFQHLLQQVQLMIQWAGIISASTGQCRFNSGFSTLFVWVVDYININPIVKSNIESLLLDELHDVCEIIITGLINYLIICAYKFERFESLVSCHQLSVVQLSLISWNRCCSLWRLRRQNNTVSVLDQEVLTSFANLVL
jgi:hypothetical protein